MAGRGAASPSQRRSATRAPTRPEVRPQVRTGVRPKKRAIALAGGGPAAGFHIGALEALEAQAVPITFDVWSLSCIGAWVGLYYNQTTGPQRAAQTYDFFNEHAFRDTDSYKGFPVNKAFAPNLRGFASAWAAHALSPQTYADLASVGAEWPEAIARWQRYLGTPSMWTSEADTNGLLLNNVLALNPATRFLASMIYLSEINGLSNIYYKDSSLLRGIGLEELDLLVAKGVGLMNREQLDRLAAAYVPGSAPPERQNVPEIYHNAWRIRVDEKTPGTIKLFNNKWAEYRHKKGTARREYLPISYASLCACSALPYIEQTVQIPNDNDAEYSEGALIDTVNFRDLVEDHPDLDEIWVCRIVDQAQVQRPKNLHDSLANLCEQFAAEVGENDIALFKHHLRKSAGRTPRVVEIPLDRTSINFHWDQANLKRGREEGRRAVEGLLGRYPELMEATTSAPVWR